MNRLVKKAKDSNIPVVQLPKLDIAEIAKKEIKDVIDAYVISEYCLNNNQSVEDIDLYQLFIDENGLVQLWQNIQDEYNSGDNSSYSGLDNNTKKYLEDIVSDMDFDTILKSELKEAKEIIGDNNVTKEPYGPGMRQTDFI